MEIFSHSREAVYESLSPLSGALWKVWEIGIQTGRGRYSWGGRQRKEAAKKQQMT
jgi:hypothetical protein